MMAVEWVLVCVCVCVCVCLCIYVCVRLCLWLFACLSMLMFVPLCPQVKPDSKTAAPAKSRAGSSSSSSSSSKRGSSSEEKNQALEGGSGDECRAEEQAFLVALYKYMKERKTPIERIPYLGFKQST